MKKIEGLSSAEVEKKRSIGLSNKRIDSYSPSYFTIVRRNLFNPMHIFLIPLLFGLAIVGLERETIVFSFFVVANTLTTSAEEIRVKRRLSKLLTKFQRTVMVIRDGTEKEISTDEVVEGDFVLANEGEGIIADGKVIYEEFLQVDESALTGESDYARVEKGNKILSGSFIVTGKCIYEAKKVGKENYLNKLGEESVSYKKVNSSLEKAGEKFILLFVLIALAAISINYLSTSTDAYSQSDRILSVTAIVSTILSQTLVFIFTLSFALSIVKLSRKGVLIQKRGAIDDLASIDTLCIDKTGTITTNEMSIQTSKFWHTDDNDFKKLFYSISHELHGRNKTLIALENYSISARKDIEYKRLDQIPFNSKNKFSSYLIEEKSKTRVLIIGAQRKFTELIKNVNEDINEYIASEDQKGLRVIVSAIIEFENNRLAEKYFLEMKDANSIKYTSQKIKFGVFTIKEEINPGIKKVLNTIKSQEINIKVISGDSLNSVRRVAKLVDLDTSKSIDLSKNKKPLENLVEEYTIFARATPEDKLKIISLLKEKGNKVAMIGDGINDVLSMKQAHVGIAMESGAKIARETADIVLLGNDYNKVPDIFYEGDNLVFNLKLATTIFLARAAFGLLLSIYFSLQREVIPFLPTTVLIFSFVGSSLPSYIVAFSRQTIKNQVGFTKGTIFSSVGTGILTFISVIAFYELQEQNLDFKTMNTAIVNLILGISLIYSLLLIHKAGKLTDFRIQLSILAGAFIFAYLQSATPFYLYPDNPNTALALIVFPLVFASFVAIMLKILAKHFKSELINRMVPAIPLGGLAIALLFPAKEYYNSVAFDLSLYTYILPISAIFALIVIAYHKVMDKVGFES